MLPSTIAFPYNGQTYQIPTAGYATEEEAIDAFLQQQNAPTSIAQTPEVTQTDVTVAPEVDPLDDPYGFAAVASTTEEVDPLDDPYGFAAYQAQNATQSTPDELDDPYGFGASPSAVPTEDTRTVAPQQQDDLSFRDWASGRGSAIMGSVAQAGAGVLETLYDQAPPLQVYRATGREYNKPGVAAIREFGADMADAGQYLKPKHPALAWVTDAVDAIAQMAPSVGASLATRNPNIGLSVMGTQVWGQTYNEAISEGATPDEAALKSMRAVAMELGPEKIFGFFDRLGITGGVKKYLTQVVAEAGSEWVTEALNVGDETIIEGKEFKGWMDFLKRTGYAGSLGAAMGGGLGVGALRKDTTPNAETLQKEMEAGEERARLALQSFKNEEAFATTERRRLEAIAADTGDQVNVPPAPITPSQALRAQPDTNIAGILGVPQRPINDGSPEFEAMRAQIVEELPADHELTDEDIDRLANLRLDSKPVPKDQQELDLDQGSGQMDLPLLRNFMAPGQFPDSGEQLSLPLGTPDYVPAEQRSRNQGVLELPPPIQRGTLTLPEKKAEAEAPVVEAPKTGLEQYSKDVQDAVKRRNIDFKNGELRLPNGDPLTLENVDKVLNSYSYKQGRYERAQQRKRLEALPDDADIASVRRADIPSGDSRAMSKKDALARVAMMEADSARFEKDLKTAAKEADPNAQYAYDDGVPSFEDSMNRMSAMNKEARLHALRGTAKPKQSKLEADIDLIVADIIEHGSATASTNKLGHNRMKAIARSKLVRDNYYDVIESNTFDGALDYQGMVDELVSILQSIREESTPYVELRTAKTRELVDKEGNPRIRVGEDGRIGTRKYKPKAEPKAEHNPAPLENLKLELSKGTRLFRGAYNGAADTLEVGDLGVHFAPDSALAAGKTGETGEVGEFTVRAKNSLVVPREPKDGAWHNPVEVLKVLKEAGIEVPVELTKAAETAVRKAMDSGEGVSAVPVKGGHVDKALGEIRKLLKQHSIDAIVYRNEHEGDKNSPSVLLLNPKAAKFVAPPVKPTAQVYDASGTFLEKQRAEVQASEDAANEPPPPKRQILIPYDQKKRIDVPYGNGTEYVHVTRSDGNKLTVEFDGDVVFVRPGKDEKGNATLTVEGKNAQLKDAARYVYERMIKTTRAEVKRSSDESRARRDRDVVDFREQVYGTTPAELRRQQLEGAEDWQELQDIWAADTDWNTPDPDAPKQITSPNGEWRATIERDGTAEVVGDFIYQTSDENGYPQAVEFDTITRLEDGTILLDSERGHLLSIAPDGTINPEDEAIPQEFLDAAVYALDILDDVRSRAFSGPTEAIEGGGSRELPLGPPLPLRNEPVRRPLTETDQQQLPLGPPTKAPPPAPPAPPVPPTPPPPTPPTPPPTGTGGTGRNLPPRGVGAGSTNPLARLAESRSVVGDPVVVMPTVPGAAISVNGRSVKEPKPNRKEKNYFLIPKWARKYIDIVRTTSLISGHDDIKIMKEIVRGNGSRSRAEAQNADAAMNTIKELYHLQKGKDISEAPLEHQRLMTDFLKGNKTRKEVMDEVGVNDKFMDALHASRTAIAALSAEMISKNMIPGEMRHSMQENLGSYITVSYAANLMRRDSNMIDMMEKIPEAMRDAWAATFVEAYMNNRDLEHLTEKTYSELKRQAQQLGLFSRTLVPDPEKPGAQKDAIVLNGIEESQIKQEHLIQAIINYNPGNKLDALNNFMAITLDSLNSQGTTSPRSRERSIERQLTLARHADKLREEGYSEKEIDHMQSTRALLLETLDPVTNVGITMNKMMQTITAHNIINDIAKFHVYGIVSIGKPDSVNGLTELLVPKGSSLGDIRVPDPNRPGEMLYASPQEDTAKTSDGIWVSPEMARMFQNLMMPENRTNVWMQAARHASAMTKIGFTAFSPGSQMRNVGSAAMLLGARSHLIAPLGSLKDALKTVVGVSARELGNKHVSDGTDRSQRQRDSDLIIEYLTDLDIWNNSVRSGPAREMMTRMLEERDLENAGNTWLTHDGIPIEDAMERLYETGNAKARKIIGPAVRPVMGSARKAMTSFRLGDEAPKAIAFMVERVRYAKLTGQQDILDMIEGRVPLTEEGAARLRAFDQGIATYIKDIYPTYSYVPVPIRALSRNVFVVSFPSFTSEMWRNQYNSIKDMGALTAGTGRYAGVPKAKRMQLLGLRVGAELIYHAATVGMVSSLSMLGATSIGLSPDDDDLDEAMIEQVRKAENGKFIPENIDASVRYLLPSYYANGQFRIMDWVPGETVTLRNADFTLPTSSLVSVVGGFWAIGEELLEGNPDRAAWELGHTILRFTEDFSGWDVLMGSAVEAVSGRTEMGRTIYDQRTDTIWEKRWAGLKHMVLNNQPTSKIIQEAVRFIDAAQEDTLGKETFEFLIGTKDREYRIDNLWAKTYRDQITHARSIPNRTIEINRLISSSEEMSDGEFTTKYLRFERQRYDAFKKMRTLVRTGESLGLTPETMQAVVDDMHGTGNPGGMKIEHILQEEYIPYKPTLKDAVSRYYPEDAAKMSLEERQYAQEANTHIIEARLEIVNAYRDQLQFGDFTP